MGNYKNIEIDFIERTLELIAQYESLLHKYKFEKQYNYTLLINCLLGLVVFPKERAISFLPKQRIDISLRREMGITQSAFNPEITDLKSLIISLRHSIAHFYISFESDDKEGFLIDKIVFRDKEKGENYIVASFVPKELLNFIRYYASWFVTIIREYKKDIYDEPR